MSLNSLTVRRRLAPTVLPRRAARLDRLRVTFSDGAATTVHAASYSLESYVPRVVCLEQPAPLVRWCRERDLRHAVVGGFFVRPEYAPLGELRLGGRPVPSVPFAEPWGGVRGCLHVDGGRIRVVPRDELPKDPEGELLQAGPVLVRDGVRVVTDRDPEGFSVAAHQFDSDITAGRYPRAALALAGDRVLAVACDGRTRRDAGMTLVELADVLVRLGAREALNLDGGGSASLVHDGRLRNRPREQHGVDLLEGRAVVTAVVFDPV